MISADRFLNLLEEKDLLPSGVVAKLRQQVAQANRPPKASSVAKALIDKGYLTPVLAKRLLETEADDPSTAATQKRSVKTINDDLSLMSSENPLDAPPAKKTGGNARTSPSREASDYQTLQPPTAEFVSDGASPSLLDDELTPLDLGGESFEASTATPLDGFMSGSAMDMNASAESDALASGKKKGIFSFLKRDKTPTKKEDWGSVFMLVGGGGLLLLILAGVGLTWYIYRLGLEQKYQQAQDYYKATSYEQAKKTYEEFALAFPKRPEASTARVLVGLCDMRQFEQGEDWVGGLASAQTVLEKINQEEGFGEKSDEVTAMLMKMAEGLAARAMDKSSPELVAKTREALVLIDKYVPKSQSQPTRLADIETKLGVTERQIGRNKELEKSIVALNAAIKQQKTAEAYDIRRALLKKYPDLLGDAKLATTMAEISKAQHAAVKAIAETKASSKEEMPSPIIATVSLAQRNTKTPLDDLQGRVVCVAAEGAAYGLDAATGKVLWRRFIGYPKSVQNIAPPPMPVNSEPGADVLAVDTAQNEVLRLEALSGKLQWRFAVGEPFVPQPVLAENRLLVATPSGKVIALDAETGDSSGGVQLPQLLSVAPAVDMTKKLIYQIAEHSNLYVLGLDDFSCKQVFLLGHDMGSITSAPAVVSGSLVLGVNDGAQDSSIRLFSVDRGSPDKPGIVIKQVQQISLKGRIDVSPAVDGNRVLVATDRGVVRVFDLTPTEKGVQLRDVAETAIEGGENVARYALLQGGQFWIADIQLTKFDVVGSKGRLVPKWIVDEQSAFLQRPIVYGPAVISVRRKPNLPGAFVSAVGVDEGTLAWETILAVPSAGELISNTQNKKLTAVTKLGGLFELETGTLKGQSVLDAPTVSIDPARLTQPIGSLVALEKGMISLAAYRGATQINVFDPTDSQMRYRWMALSDKSACPPIDLAGGLLIPTQGGGIFLLDPQNGKSLTAPFQAKLDNGVKPSWQKPAACGKQEFIISDGKSTLYRIGRVDAPKPHLEALEQIEAAPDRDSPLAAVGNVAFVATASQSLGIFELPKLKRLNEHKLSGRCVWGPAVLGSLVLLATDDDQLLCFDAKGGKVWQTALAYGPLAGSPLAVQDGFLLASANGVIWRVDAKAGKEQGKVETARSLASGPSVMENQVFVVGTDGSIYEVKQP
jgi:outer membrane protein assembly factor BamB/TolA-binding protein